MKMERISEIHDALHLKRNDESLYLTILVSFNSKTEIKSQDKPSSLKKSHDKKERELVVGRGGIRRPSGRAHQLMRMVELRVPTTSGCARTQNEMERSLPHSESAGVFDKRQENTWVKSWKASELLGVDKLTRRPGKFCRFRHLRKIRDEPRAAEEFLEEVKHRRQQTKDDMWMELEEYIASGDSEKLRSGCMNAPIWQTVQSSRTKAENLENDFNEIAATMYLVSLVAFASHVGWRTEP